MLQRLMGAAVLLALSSACGQSGTDGPANGTGGLGSDAGDGGSGLDGSAGFGGGVTEYEVIAISDDSPIWSIGSTETHIYWLTRGTTNLVTGVENSDGALHRQSLDGGDVEVVADALEKPLAFRITSTHAYLWSEDDTLDPQSGTVIQRVELDGGELEPVEIASRSVSHFASFEDRAYFFQPLEEGAGVFEHVSGQEPRKVFEIDRQEFLWFEVDASYLYYQGNGGLHRVALAEGASELLSSGLWYFDLSTESSRIVAVDATSELRTEIDLLAMPSSGGAWEAIASVPLSPDAGYGGYSAPQARGSRWFVWTSTQPESDSYEYVLTAWTAPLDGGEPVSIQSPPDIAIPPYYSLVSVGAPDAVFFASETTLVKVSLD